LTDYLEGSLQQARVDAINEHLRGCDLCERFGGEFGAMIQTLRARLAEAEPVPEDVVERLRQKLGI
jgi:anti-sigma factor RsiW